MSVAVTMSVQLSWSDPRISLHPSLGPTLNSQKIMPGGVRELTVTTSTFRELGMWLPDYNVHYAQSGMYGVLRIDNNVQLSNITLIQRPVAEGETKLWGSQLYAIEVIWSRQLGDTSGGGEQAVMGWGNLDWYMYPFGTNTLNIDFECEPGIVCALLSQAVRGAYAYEGAVSIEGRMPTAGRRLAISGGGIAVALSDRSHGDWPTAMPLVEGSLRWEEIDSGGPNPVYRVSFTLSRTAMLQLVRLIIPTVFIMLLGLTLFFVTDATWTVGMCFNVLLVVSVISVEVKDFFPSHVTYMSWIDWFVLSNLSIIMTCSFLGVVCIIAGQSELEYWKRLDKALDESISSTQPISAIIINIVLIYVGSMGGGAGSINGPGAGSRIDNVKNIVVTFFICDVIVFATTFAFKWKTKSTAGGGKGCGIIARVRARHRRREDGNGTPGVAEHPSHTCMYA